MTLAVDVAITTAIVSLFCISHSLLASNKAKKFFKKKFGNLIAFYRAGYNIISVFSLIICYEMLPTINITVYDLPTPYDLIVFSFQILSLLGFVWSAKYFSGSEFIGLAQINRYKADNYNENDLDEKSELRIEGPYKYSRHPVYFFSILFLILRPAMGLTYLIIVIIFTIYFFIGSIFEEKRLVEKFGETYIQYQASVPRIIPVKLFRA